MDIRRTSFDSGDNRSPTLEKMAKKRKENVQRPSRSSSTTSEKEARVSAIPDPKVVPVEIAGNLHKQGRLLKKWKPRFFQIQGNCLYYYKNYEKKECLGLIDLLKCYYVGKSSAASFGSAFELQTWGRVHLLAARDEQDAEKWINTIKKKMNAEARERDKKGSKGEVVSVIPGELRSRRATIKISKTNRKANVKPSSSLHEMNLSDLKSLDEGLEEKPNAAEPEKKPSGNFTSSQSYPNFKSKQVTTTAIPELVGTELSDQESTTPSPEGRKDSTVSASKILSQPLKNDSPPSINSPFQNASIADVDLPPPLKQPDPMSDTFLPPASTNLVPLTKRPSPISNVTTHPQSVNRPPLTRPMSAAYIELPPPPTLVPMKRASTLSDMKLPPPIDFQIPQSRPLTGMDLPPPVMFDPVDISNVPLPPPVLDFTLQQVDPSGLLPSMNANSEVTSIEVTLPELPALNEQVQDQTGFTSAKLEHLKTKLPPLVPVNHIPSAIDQLKYVLANDQTQPCDPRQFSLLPELKKTWLSEPNGIEQLRHFLNIYQ